MRRIAGVDIGNSTTEVCIAQIQDDKSVLFESSYRVDTTGTKGTLQNLTGIKNALNGALNLINKEMKNIDLIRINEAAPVIGDTAMETITETIITESTMIGHNPLTPSGQGIGVGITALLEELPNKSKDQSYIALVPSSFDYETAASMLNDLKQDVKAVIVEKDEAVLIHNRLKHKVPIIDEVLQIHKIPLNMKAAVEVASTGKTITTLSNPYGIAKIFALTPKEVKMIVPIAKSLIGNRSAVVVRTPLGEVKERVIPAGTLMIKGKGSKLETIGIDEGAQAIMQKIEQVGTIEQIVGEAGSNVGGMLNRMKEELASLSDQDYDSIHIKDILAIDTMIPVDVKGALAGEIAMENAVAIAAMVKSKKLPIQEIANALEKDLRVKVVVAGVEAVMATLGAWTTPGSDLPIAMLDLGGGSTDAALLDQKGTIYSTHLAGAGAFITMMIDYELGLNNRSLAEDIKRYPLAKVESLFHIRMENGEVIFFENPLSPTIFGKVVVCKEDDFIPIEKRHTMEKIVGTRKHIKHNVFVKNTIRALTKIAPLGNIRHIPNVVLVGGSALDFEIPEMILTELARYNIVSGRGEIRGVEGPRNAVATGLVMS
ncbi:MAG TPA: diol dehydratase reactivase subunit alpha, partial [Epulopiscium sp.]|nr:diol dehydratase reactivase subunit alpha [Candidatus Epulonipiscium sp.]